MRRFVPGLLLVLLGLAGFVWMSVLLAMSGPQTGRDRWLAPLLRWGSLAVALVGVALMARAWRRGR